ncbi:MAG: hypothetical protein K6346_07575 [Halothiobacillaceae bacterium]
MPEGDVMDGQAFEVGRCKKNINLATLEASLQPCSEAGGKPGRFVDRVRDVDHQVDISAMLPVIQARSEKPCMRVLAKDLMRGLANDGDLFAGYAHGWLGISNRLIMGTLQSLPKRSRV